MSGLTILVLAIVGLFVLLAVLFFFLAPRLTDAGKRKRGPSGDDWQSKRKKR